VKYFGIKGDTLYFLEGWIPASAGMTEGKIFVAIEREVG